MKAEDSQKTISRELHSKPRTAKLHQCTDARISLENRHFSPLLGTLGLPSRRQSGLGMSLQQHEIGPGACPSRLPGNLVAASENRHIEFRLWDSHLAQGAESESVQLRAWRAVLADNMAVSKFSDLEYRMTEIEEQLEKRGGALAPGGWARLGGPPMATANRLGE